MPAVADEEPADADAGGATLEGAGQAAGPAAAAPGAVGRPTRAVAHAVETAGVRVGHLALEVPGAGLAEGDRAEGVAGLVPVGLHRGDGWEEDV